MTTRLRMVTIDAEGPHAGRLGALAIIAAFGRHLTRRQLDVLAIMAAHPHDDEGELVREGLAVYLGDERVAARTVNALLRACAIRPDGFSSGVERYRINDTGRELLRAHGRPVPA